MKRLLYLSAITAAMSVSVTASAENTGHATFDFSKHVCKSTTNSRSVFDSRRMKDIKAANARMFDNGSSRFNRQGKKNEDGTYSPDFVFENKEMTGDIDGPNGQTWFYDGEIKYEKIVHNEYYTELLPVEFTINIYDGDMKLFTTISDRCELKEDEARVRQIDLLPIITQKYFNTDDKYEAAVTILVNPKSYGIRPYTYVYSLGNDKDEEGFDVPVRVVDGMVSDVLNASDTDHENVLMTFIAEGNRSGLSDEEVFDSEHPENYWNYQLGNFVHLTMYGNADEEGNFQKVFEKDIIYYQSQGNMQDDPLCLTMLHDGKPVIAFPYYEQVYYQPFYSYDAELYPTENNNLVIELWQQPAAGEQFVKTQTTKVPVVKAPGEDVVCSYYGIGDFNWTKDVSYDGDKASFVVTRRDYVAGSDSERKSYIAYDPEGQVKKVLYENTISHSNLSDLPGFDPMVVFASADDAQGYIFHFMNLRTFETELDLPYGLRTEDSDEPDYIMANMDRALTADGKDYYYVAEMRMPEYDDINDLTFMRVAWIDREGKLDNIEKINMGNNINYAQLYVSALTLDPHFFNKDDSREYMLLIKRALNGDEAGSTLSTEQLLVAQPVSTEQPSGKDLMLLGDCEYGSLSYITPMVTPTKNRLCVSYVRSNEDTQRLLTVVYYDLPLDGDDPGKDPGSVEGIGTEDGFTFDGFSVTAPGSDISVFNMEGQRVAAGHDSLNLSGLANGLYIVRANGRAAKIMIH